MAVAVMGDFELEKIRAEIQQEKQMKEMLEQSTAELRFTIDELEKRFDGVVDEGNEWKTRCETQAEINEQLEKQILMLQNKVQEAKSNLKDGSKDKKDGAGKSPKDMKNFDDLSDANPQMVRMLEKEKNMLHSQMRDIEWRLDQESKAYHKANDERKNYNLEISHTKQVMSENSGRQKASLSSSNLEPIPSSRTPRDMGRMSRVTKQHKKNLNSKFSTNGQGRNYAGSHSSLSNIPEDQRILDPKRGPIRKTAAVKSLPSLDMA